MTVPDHTQPTHQSPSTTESELSLLDIGTAIGEEKWIFFGITLIGTAGALAAALLWPREFTASTIVLPPQQQQSSAAGALAQLGALAGVVGTGTMVKSSDDMYIAFLKTRRLQDALIERFQLKTRYEQKSLAGARKKLTDSVAISSDKKAGLITIEVDDRDANVAAQLANAHVEELRKLLSKLAVTDAQQRRVFFEQQVIKTKESLNTAELDFRREQAESGLVVSQALAESGVKESAYIRAQIASREVQIQALRRFATDQHPEMQRLTIEVSALRGQLNQLEEGGDAKDVARSARGIRAVQAFRNMKVQEALLEVFIRQLEAARADESREGPLLQQVDVAVAPEKATKPQRSAILMGGASASLTLGLAIALTRWYRRQPKSIAAQLAHARFKNAWRG